MLSTPDRPATDHPGEPAASGPLRGGWPDPAGLARAAATLGRALAGALVTAGRTGPAPRDEIARAVQRHRHLSALFGRICDQHRLRVQVRGPIPRGPVILAANHLSYWDPLVVSSVLPCVPVAKSEVARWPLIGAWGRLFGVLYVRRDDVYAGARVLRQIERLLARGVPVLNFPEGTTSDGREVLPFRRGVFGIARRAGVAVVPVALHYARPDMAWTGDALFLPHYLRVTASVATEVQLRFGAPVSARPGESAAALAERVRQQIAGLRGEADGSAGPDRDAAAAALSAPAPG